MSQRDQAHRPSRLRVLGALAIATSVLLTACQPASKAAGKSTSRTMSATKTAPVQTPSSAPNGAGTGSVSAGAGTPSATKTTAATSTAETSTAPAVAGIVVAGSALTGFAPAPGACHIRAAANGQPLPDPRCSPGAVDAAVRQANIAMTICRSGYTATVRPPTSVTEPFKLLDEKAYGVYSGELDHLIPLELGGSSDAHNLWVEPGPIPNPKDTVENDLHAAVCRGRVSLITAQRLIATDWTTALAKVGEAPPAHAPTATKPATTTTKPAPTTTTKTAALTCSASMSNTSPAQNTTTDVLITTAAGASLTVTAHYKSRDTTHAATADGTGHASVPFDISRATIGYTIVVDVSASADGHTATCSTAFTPR